MDEPRDPDEGPDPDDPEGFDDLGPLDEHESWHVEQDLDDLEAFERVFAEDGVRGVSMFCHDCDAEHYYPWDMLRGSLEMLLETGEVPVHEPAFDPDPTAYVPWEYARGYVDALRDAGVDQRVPVDQCERCGLALTDEVGLANWCPRCGSPLLLQRLRTVLLGSGLSREDAADVLRAVGLPLR